MRVRSSILLSLILLFPANASAAGYRVRTGDTLSAIAARYHTTIATLVRINHLRDANFITAGAILLVPGGGSRANYYRVHWGDTLIGLASRFGLSIAAIRGLNPQLGAYPLAGTWLRLDSASVAAPAAGGSSYVVQPGDSLISIAGRFGVTPAAIASANGLADPNQIVIGSALAIPPAPAVPSSSPQVQSLITSWAETYGVAPSLALALAWQESGFNQDVVSSTGAVGVMQVEPYTEERIAVLLGRQFNLYDVNDNIHAGVYWLAHLIAYYGGDQHLAIAAYYEGTRSVSRYGLFADTVQYVDNVLALQARFGG